MHLTTIENALSILAETTDPTQAPRILARLCMGSAQPTLASQRLVAWYGAELMAGIDPSAPVRTVPLSDLWTDVGVYHDRTFQRWVSQTIAERVSDPIRHDELIEDDGDLTWELAPTSRYEVRPVYAVSAFEGSDMVAICETVGEKLAALDFAPLGIFWAIYDTDDGMWVDDFSNTFVPDIELPTQDGDSIEAYEDQDEAEGSAERLNREDAEANVYGYPWANCNAYRVKWGISAENLDRAGFRRATHTPSDSEYFGVDGGGYSFDVHWVRLALLCAGSEGVPTDSGQRVYVQGYKGE